MIKNFPFNSLKLKSVSTSIEAEVIECSDEYHAIQFNGPATNHCVTEEIKFHTKISSKFRVQKSEHHLNIFYKNPIKF